MSKLYLSFFLLLGVALSEPLSLPMVTMVTGQ